jgi:hydroxyacylglutathione hydrolase
MDVLSVRTPGLGDATYLLTHDGKGVLVDPQRDIERFTSLADAHGVQIRFTLETHLHNDYISGGPDVARATGAELVLPAAAGAAYPHTQAFHLEDLDGGDGLVVRPIHTPGHTPEHTSYLVLIDGEPVALFSGGSLLVGSAGRPDLLGMPRARSLAVAQYGSVNRLAQLPDAVGLYPTHGEGSFCTVTGAGRTTSTIGTEKLTNPVLAHADVESFVAAQLADLQPYPRYYRHMGPGNTLGLPPMPDVEVRRSDPEQVAERVANGEAQVVDMRPRAAVAAGHLPGSTAIEMSESFGTWLGWVLDYDQPVALVADPGQDVAEAVVQLARIGKDDVCCTVSPLPAEIATASYDSLELPEFLDRLNAPHAQLLDVRSPSEFAARSVPGSVHRYLPDLTDGGIPAELDPATPVLVACGSGYRAAIAATLLLQAGYTPVALATGGIDEILAATELAAA